MGTYFNPPEQLPRVARRIHGETYEKLAAQLQPDEKLFGHYQRPTFQNAVWLFSPEEFEEFESQARRGLILRLGFHAMPGQTFRERVKEVKWPANRSTD